MEWWRIGELEYWSDGVMEEWKRESVGVTECWGIGEKKLGCYPWKISLILPAR